MKRKLNVLILEDRPDDAELVGYELRRAGYDAHWERVERVDDFKGQLKPGLDLILADINLSQFDGLKALEILNESGLDIPFIVVTGAYEEIALECLKQGAADYLLKDRLARLGSAVDTALTERQIRLEKKQIEEDLRYSEERYRSIFEGVQDAILIEDAHGIVLDVNQRACEMYGLEYERFVGTDAHDIIAPGGTYVDFTSSTEEIPDHPIENLNIRSNGEVFPVELTVQTQIIHSELVYILVARDISARNQMESALWERTERFRHLAEASLSCILITNDALQITYRNRIARQYCDLQRQDAPICILDFIDEEFRDQVKRAVAGVRATNEGVVLGTVDPVVVSAPGKNFPAEISISTWATEDQRFFSFIIRDLTEQEEARQEEQVQHRLAAVGQMAAGIAHDFNNALMPIGLYAEMILKDEDISERMRDQMRTILKQADRAARLTAQILDFSRQALLSIRPLDTGRFLKNLVQELFTRTFPSNIMITVEECDEKCVIKADPNRMQQVFLNLALNARDAMPGGGKLSFSVRCISVGGDDPNGDQLPPGDWVHVAVADNGSGIPEETLPYIFEPFFTTKSRGEGSGLGLSQVYGIVTQHNGFIRVESEVGAGTVFHVYLPAVDEVVTDEKQISPHQSRSNEEAVLVVEDDLVNRRTICDILEYADYSVLAAADGEEALEILQQGGQQIDIIMCDMLLPGMNGIELLPGFRKILPDAGLILITGHPIDEEERLRIEQSGVTWLLKPFTYDDVLRAMRLALDKSSRD